MEQRLREGQMEPKWSLLEPVSHNRQAVRRGGNLRSGHDGGLRPGPVKDSARNADQNKDVDNSPNW